MYPYDRQTETVGISLAVGICITTVGIGLTRPDRTGYKTVHRPVMSSV